MSQAKPILGFRTRTAAAMALLRRGEKPAAIARAFQKASGQPVSEKMILDLETNFYRQQARRLERAGRLFRMVAESDRCAALAALKRLAGEIEAGR